MAVAVRVGEPDAGLAELDSGGGVRDGLRHRPVPLAGVAPVARHAVELDHVGQAPSQQVDEFMVGAGDHADRGGPAADRHELPPGRREGRVVEGDGRQRLGGCPVVAGHLDRDQQRQAVDRSLVAGLLVGVAQGERAGQQVRAGVGVDLDRSAALDGADLEPGPVVGERVWPAQRS